MLAEDISEDFSEDRRYHLYSILEYFCVSPKSSRKMAFFWEVFGSFCPLGFDLSRLPLKGRESPLWTGESRSGAWVNVPQSRLFLRPQNPSQNCVFEASELVSTKTLPSGGPGLHALLNYFGINCRFDYTYTYTLIVLGINFKSVIGGLWGYTCTLEITLTLLNSFQINFPKITLTLTLLLVFELQM